MNRNKKIKAYKKGHYAEWLAAVYLFLRGYKILKLRYKSPVGEIDIIARKGSALVIVEVKARAEKSAALESINPRNKIRVEKATLHYISQNPELMACDVRFDVIALGASRLWPFSLQHLDNAWHAHT